MPNGEKITIENGKLVRDEVKGRFII